jgi:hypothetical protein
MVPTRASFICLPAWPAGRCTSATLRLVRSTSVPIAERLALPISKSPSQWPATRRPATSAGRSVIIFMGAPKRDLRSIVAQLFSMDGTALSRRRRRRGGEFTGRVGTRPCPASALVGDDPASVTHVNIKRRRCEQNSVDPPLVRLGPATSSAAAVEQVAALSADEYVDGILVQHPAPAHVDERAMFEAISPTKGVEGASTRSFAAMGFDLPGHRSCTPAGRSAARAVAQTSWRR